MNEKLEEFLMLFFRVILGIEILTFLDEGAKDEALALAMSYLRSRS
jgi:hypothetical protein